jgi:hypothetical protein
MWKRLIHIRSGQHLWTGKLDLYFGDKFFRTPGLQALPGRRCNSPRALQPHSMYERKVPYSRVANSPPIDDLWGICQCCDEYEEPLSQFQNSSVTRYAANAAT